MGWGGGTGAATAAGSTKPFLSSQHAGGSSSGLRTTGGKFGTEETFQSPFRTTGVSGGTRGHGDTIGCRRASAHAPSPNHLSGELPRCITWTTSRLSRQEFHKKCQKESLLRASVNRIFLSLGSDSNVICWSNEIRAEERFQGFHLIKTTFSIGPTVPN